MKSEVQNTLGQAKKPEWLDIQVELSKWIDFFQLDLSWSPWFTTIHAVILDSIMMINLVYDEYISIWWTCKQTFFLLCTSFTTRETILTARLKKQNTQT